MKIKIKRNLNKSNKEILKIFNEYNNINYISFYLSNTNNLYFIINKNEKILFSNNYNNMLYLLSYLLENTNIIIYLKHINKVNDLNFNYVIELNKFNEIENKKENENYKNFIIELMKNEKI